MPSITNGNSISSSAQILDGIIVDADINAAAAISWSKVNTALQVVNADVSATAAIVDTKLAQITTASKVSGAAITSLASLPAGAGVIPSANSPLKPQPYFVIAEPPVSFTAIITGGARAIVLPNATQTAFYVTLLIPSTATIDSIQLLTAQQTGQAANYVMQYYLQGMSGAGAHETDNSTGHVIAANASANVATKYTIPAAAYDGLTKGIPWAWEISRMGADGSDTASGDLYALGLIVNLS